MYHLLFYLIRVGPREDQQDTTSTQGPQGTDTKPELLGLTRYLIHH
jgi:hypothetical protein